MTKKEEKRLEKRKTAIRFVIAPFVFGLAMLILGIVGLAGNNSDFEAYKNSTDIRTVDATVTYAAIHQDKPLSGERPQDYWEAELRYTVEGTEYKGKDRFYKEVKAGDTVSIEVYRTEKGTYEIPTATTETGNKLSNLLMYLAIGVGALITAGSVFYLVDELRKTRKKQ